MICSVSHFNSILQSCLWGAPASTSHPIDLGNSDFACYSFQWQFVDLECLNEKAEKLFSFNYILKQRKERRRMALESCHTFVWFIHFHCGLSSFHFSITRRYVSVSQALHLNTIHLSRYIYTFGRSQYFAKYHPILLSRIQKIFHKSRPVRSVYSLPLHA